MLNLTDSQKAISANTYTEQFLDNLDRVLSEDNRCYGVKICLAGAENAHLRDGLYRIGVTNIVLSYYYLQNWLLNRTVEEISDDLGRFNFVLLSSGIDAFLRDLKEQKSNKETIRIYTETYYKELMRIGTCFAGCMDVFAVDSLSPGSDIRQTVRDAGVVLMPVIRGEDLEYYEQSGWFSDYPYLVLDTRVKPKNGNKNYVSEVRKICRKNNVLLHNYGSLDSDTLLKSDFYSADSISWLDGSRYGSVMYFDAGRVRQTKKNRKKIIDRYKSRFEENGLIWSDIENNVSVEVNLVNALAWKQQADYLKYAAKDCYWLTTEEKNRAIVLRSKAFNAEGLLNRKTSIERANTRRSLVIKDIDYDDRVHETLYCDTCFMTGKCPRYEAGKSCGYDINIRIGSPEDLKKMLQIILEAQYGRAMTGVLFEKLQGGSINSDVSSELQRLITLVSDMKTILKKESEAEMTIHAKGSGGTLSNMLASVFSKTGSGNSGSGNTRVQRGANKIIDVTPDKE